MDEYFTVMLKENDTSNLKLLNEKLTDGFRIDDRIDVGRSTVVTLRRRVRNSELTLRSQTREIPVAVDLGSEYGMTSEGI